MNACSRFPVTADLLLDAAVWATTPVLTLWSNNASTSSAGVPFLLDSCMTGADKHLRGVQEKLNTRTIDEELTADPELLKQVDEDISKGSYY